MNREGNPTYATPQQPYYGSQGNLQGYPPQTSAQGYPPQQQNNPTGFSTDQQQQNNPTGYSTSYSQNHNNQTGYSTGNPQNQNSQTGYSTGNPQNLNNPTATGYPQQQANTFSYPAQSNSTAVYSSQSNNPVGYSNNAGYAQQQNTSGYPQQQNNLAYAQHSSYAQQQAALPSSQSIPQQQKSQTQQLPSPNQQYQTSNQYPTSQYLNQYGGQPDQYGQQSYSQQNAQTFNNGYQQASSPPPLNPQYQQSSSLPSLQQPPTPNALSAPSSSRINPAMIPNPVSVQEADMARFGPSNPHYYTSQIADQPPPLPATAALGAVRIIDDGNATSRFARLTTYQIPAMDDLCQSSRIPLAMVVQPMASEQSPPPLVDHGAGGPVRCFRCRAYINPYVQFVRGGRAYQCNICGMENEVREDYFCNLDASGRRADLAMRPELVFGTVDFAVTPEYWSKKRAGLVPRVIVGLDASRGAVQSGAFLAAVLALKSYITGLMAEEAQPPKMALMTYDRAIHFYQILEPAMTVQTVVMSDVMDPFLPAHPDALFFCPQQAGSVILGLLERLPRIYAETRIIDSCLGSAASLAMEALRETAGRVVIFQTTLPSWGLGGALKNREEGGNAEKAGAHLLPQTDFYGRLGKQAAPLGVAFSIFATPSTSLDLASIAGAGLVGDTGGNLQVYPKFSFDLHASRLASDFATSLETPTAYDCTMRVRSGSGLEVKGYLGNMTSLNGTDQHFGMISADQAFLVEFVHDGGKLEGERMAFQTALLYTDSHSGARRVRVINLNVPVTTSIANVFRMADLDAILAYLTRKAVSNEELLAGSSANSNSSPNNPFASLSSANLIGRTVAMLAAYRKHCAGSMSAGQLVLPDALKLLPLYTLAILKQPVLGVISTDERVQWILRFREIGMEGLSSLLYPRLIPLHRWLQGLDEADSHIPEAIRLSAENLEPTGLYLSENAHRACLWVGSSVDQSLINGLLGGGSTGILLALETIPSRKLRGLLAALQRMHSRHLGLSIIRQGIDITLEMEWRSRTLIEDPASSNATVAAVGGSAAAPLSVLPSYVDFLCRIHGQIQQDLTATPTLAERAALLNFMHH